MHIFPNEKKYIGVTCCKPNRRWQNGYGYVTQSYMYRAIQKYGWENIEHKIIANNLTANQASKMEAELVELYQTTDKDKGYNIKPGGAVGYHLSEEHKKKIGKANAGSNNGMYGYKYTDEEIRYKSEHSPWKGRKHTEESKKKISEDHKAHPKKYSRKGENHPMFGKKHSLESRKKQSESAKRRGYCGHANRMVDMLSLEGKYIRTFISMEEASRFIGKKNGAQNIGSVCRGVRKAAHGYIWRYADAE